MGVFCKIHVIEPPNKEFTPGSVVCGHIKYALDEDTVVKSVNVSFRGCGRLSIEKHEGKKSTTYRNAEEYIHVQNNIFNEATGKALAVGDYDTSFHFQLPEDIPPSLNYIKSGGNYSVNCKICYLVKIEFVVPGTFKFNKKFMKEINVVSNIRPKLLMEPVIYGDRKKLFQPFRLNESFVNMKAYVKQPVVEPGEKVELVYTITNDTNKTINAIEVKVIEVYTFHAKYKINPVEKCADVLGTDFKTASLKSGESVERDFEIFMPSDLHCLDHSKIVSRDYAILIIVHLPVPHLNMPLRIPIQVGRTSIPRFIPDVNYCNNEASNEPPTYWEAMNEFNDKSVKVKVKDFKN